jgi:hypothetical protein
MDSKKRHGTVLKTKAVLTQMVGTELNHALIVRQLPVESAQGLHALQSVLRQGFGSRREGVADHPFIELVSILNSKNEKMIKMRVPVNNCGFSCKNPAKKKLKKKN